MFMDAANTYLNIIPNMNQFVYYLPASLLGEHQRTIYISNIASVLISVFPFFHCFVFPLCPGDHPSSYQKKVSLF